MAVTAGGHGGAVQPEPQAKPKPKLRPPPHYLWAVLHLRLCSLQTQALAGATQSLLPEDQRQGDRLRQLLERLSARLGPNQVLGIRPVADCAELQVRKKGAIKSVAAYAGNTWATALNDAEMPPQAGLHPSWLLTAP